MERHTAQSALPETQHNEVVPDLRCTPGPGLRRHDRKSAFRALVQKWGANVQGLSRSTRYSERCYPAIAVTSYCRCGRKLYILKINTVIEHNLQTEVFSKVDVAKSPQR